MADLGFGRNRSDEIREWMDVNRKLHKHGLESVHVLPSNEVKIQSDRYICVDVDSSRAIRTALMSLISEVNRKDNMMQDLVKSNNNLEKEVSELKNELDTLHSKTRDTKILRDRSRTRAQDVENERASSSAFSKDETEKLKGTSLTSKCAYLEGKVMEQEKELDRLRKEVKSFAKEEVQRGKRQNQIFVDFRKRFPHSHSPVDLKLLDLIDSYETQIQTLQRQLGGIRKEDGFSQSENLSNSAYSSNFKSLIKSYEKQLSEQGKKLKKVEQENLQLRQEHGLNCDLKDYRSLTQRIKKLEHLLHLHNISVPGDKPVIDSPLRRQKFSTTVSDLDNLPAEQCHHYLRQVCRELGTDNLDDLVSTIRDITDQSHNSARFYEYCKELAEIVEGLNEGCHQSRSTRLLRSPDNILCDSNMRYYLEVIQNWRKDISGLGDLQEALNSLLDKTVPWMRAHMDSDHRVDEMTELVERVIHAYKQETGHMLMENVSRGTLENIVSHFQTLFDVPRISGVFPRMNDVYKNLGESRNVMSSLKSLLGLDPCTHASGLVDAVGRLCHMYNSTTAKQLKKLLQTDDLHGVIRRLEEHSEFFPAFHGIMHKLFEILGVDRMDEIIPAVRALKLLAK